MLYDVGRLSIAAVLCLSGNMTESRVHIIDGDA
jgi:hypothetical protein